jgi:hypothetical protein
MRMFAEPAKIGIIVLAHGLDVVSLLMPYKEDDGRRFASGLHSIDSDERGGADPWEMSFRSGNF